MAKIVTTQLNTLRVAFVSTEKNSFVCLVNSVDDSTVYTFSKNRIALERIRALNLKDVELLAALTDEYRFEGVPHSLEYVPRMEGLIDLAIIALTRASAESFYPVEDLIQALEATPGALERVFRHAESDSLVDILSNHLSLAACMNLASNIQEADSRKSLKKFKALVSRDGVTYDLLMQHFEQRLLREDSSSSSYADFLFETLTRLDKQALIAWLLRQLQDKERTSQVRRYAFIRLTAKPIDQENEIVEPCKAIAEDTENPTDLRQYIISRYHFTPPENRSNVPSIL